MRRAKVGLTLAVTAFVWGGRGPGLAGQVTPLPFGSGPSPSPPRAVLEGPGGAVPSGFLPQSLEEAARRLGDLWTRGDAPLLESLLKEDGLRLQLLQEDHRSVSARKGRAALQEFFQRFPGGRAELVRVSFAGPDSPRGSAEYRVAVPQPGAPLLLTLFVGFERSEGRWVVSELRVLR